MDEQFKKASRPPWIAFAPALVLLMACLASRLAGQGPDYSVLRINEVITQNDTQRPGNQLGGHPDTLEIYNSGDIPLSLGGSRFGEQRIGVSREASPPYGAAWYFPLGAQSNIPAKGFIVVFLDKRPEGAPACELYTGFNLASDGSEVLTLLGPKAEDGTRPVLDQVYLPPLEADVSIGRYPDGAGLAPVPLAETTQVFHYNPPGTTSFGDCNWDANCNLVLGLCSGAANGPGGNLAPRVERMSYSTNHPVAGEAVEIEARVKDDKEPAAPNIARVLIRYSVDGGPTVEVPMTFDEVRGVQTGKDDVPPRPLARWSFWKGTIPGQPAAGAKVDFLCYVEDKEGYSSTDPRTICRPGMGPCDRDFGGPDCELDAEDVTCKDPSFEGVRYVECSVPFHYVSGYEPRGDLVNLVINEVVSNQTHLLKDPTEPDCKPKDGCPSAFTDCCKWSEDFLELHNVSASGAVDLAGLWLSDSPFHPRKWRFPAGSSIGPGEYLIVWLDNDGGKCPDPSVPDTKRPCFWECPDPTDPVKKHYHTNFALDAGGDEVYLYDTEENSYGVIHGLELGRMEADHSLSLVPDGDRQGCWMDTDAPTPGSANAGSCAARFRRGDASGDCALDITDGISVLNYLFKSGPEPLCPDAADADDNGTLEITDAVYLLQYLFLGGPEPPAPGPVSLGEDPSEDSLGPCKTTCS